MELNKDVIMPVGPKKRAGTVGFKLEFKLHGTRPHKSGWVSVPFDIFEQWSGYRPSDNKIQRSGWRPLNLNILLSQGGIFNQEPHLQRFSHFNRRLHWDPDINPSKRNHNHVHYHNNQHYNDQQRVIRVQLRFRGCSRQEFLVCWIDQWNQWWGGPLETAYRLQHAFRCQDQLWVRLHLPTGIWFGKPIHEPRCEDLSRQSDLRPKRHHFLRAWFRSQSRMQRIRCQLQHNRLIQLWCMSVGILPALLSHQRAGWRMSSLWLSMQDLSLSIGLFDMHRKHSSQCKHRNVRVLVIFCDFRQLYYTDG